MKINYKKWIIILSIILSILLIVTYFIFTNKNEVIDNSNEYTYENQLIRESDIIFTLKGDENYELEVGNEYEEPGYTASLKDGTDISDYVEIINSNLIKDGKYQIIYLLKYKNIKKVIYRNVILKNNLKQDNKKNDEDINNKEEDKNNQNNQENNNNDNKDNNVPNVSKSIINLNLNGYSEIYILKQQKYVEQGVFAYDTKDGNISSKVKITGVVNTNNVGTYTITYTVTNSENTTKSIKRKVIIYDYDYKINIVKGDKIQLTFTTNSDAVEYISINDLVQKVYGKTVKVNIEDNKEYTIKIYDKYGYMKETYYDFIKPVASCNANISNNQTSVNVSARDNDGILKYIYSFNEKKYTTEKNNYLLSGVYKNVQVEVFDKKNNSTKITCNVIDSTPIYESGLKEKKYLNWNYYLYVPSNVKQSDKKPLIVFLHGSGEAGSKISALSSYGFARYIKKGMSYDAFILMPQLEKDGNWSNTKSINQTLDLIKKVVAEYNIDETRISISGFSLGAMAVPYLLKQEPNYFSCAVLIALCGRGSSYAEYFRNVPTRIFAGSNDTSMGNSSTTKSFVNALKKINNNVEFKVYSNKPHNVVNYVLEDGTVANWMIQQQRK